MSFILLVEQTAPETPSTAQVVFYPKSDGKLYSKDDAGTESLVSHANPITVVEGGTGVVSISSYSIITGGTTSSGPFQTFGTGVSTEILQSNGPGALPVWTVASIPATQAQMEAAISTTIFSSPGGQQFHPGHPKAWVNFNSAGTIAVSYNITSITDTATGNWGVVIGTDFSSGNYVGLITGGYYDGGTPTTLTYNMRAAPIAGTYTIRANDSQTPPGNDRDPNVPDQIHVLFLGDQA